ncbi:unnamed protein product [Hymenolepis diminuta]|uniref:Uncharacterized protein n=1 Tax=Hymenolepis diminuta TaxID=6216 RepID=A0A564XXH3_HYMDI|nr:unnamed protein product [Hymenolepis diminuta]
MVPISTSISPQIPSPTTELQTINHKLQRSSSPKATLSKKFNTCILLAVNDKSKSRMEQSPNEATTDA